MRSLVPTCLTLLPLVIALLGNVLCAADEPNAAANRPSPEEALKAAMRNAENHGKEGYGEQFCWHANTAMNQWVLAYKAWHDTAWLDAGVKYFDYLVSKMNTGPDNYKGWVGPYIYQTDVWADVHVGDSILMEKMLSFSELVLKEEPALKEKYGEAAQRYVDMTKRDLIEKWDSRGTWREDGPFGAYTSWDVFCQPNDLKNWKKSDDAKNVRLSLPFNKQNDMGLALLKLWRITGEAKYREKAVRIFSFMKSRMQLVHDPSGFDYYVWNYWEPFGRWDIDAKTGLTRHWMNVHPYRNYQAGEIHQIAEAYHTGVVFGAEDIQRIVNTNLKVMWNGDKEKPAWVNSNARLPVPELTEEEKKARAEKEKDNPYAKEGRAGSLWAALVDFDPTVRELYAASLRGGIGRAYYENVTAKRPAGMKRHHCEEDKATVTSFPLHPCMSLTAVAVMPSVVRLSESSSAVVMCKARVPVELEVAVYRADGTGPRHLIYQGKVNGGTDGMAGEMLVPWHPGASNPTAPQPGLVPGKYVMRWTVADGYREFPVTIMP